MIRVESLTKRYGHKLAVEDLSFEVRAGAVTGFLGPNGAGKSTTMRMILGLDRPDAGRALVAGRPFAARPDGLRQVGALLDASEIHGGMRAIAHLAAAPRDHRPRPDPGAGGARPGRAGARRTATRRQLLPRHAPAARHRPGPAG